ncbi:MmyB family transcriptional regulator [Streptomyces lydicus]|uniref:MmyB family transcriptional regulator n=1 Tax=Streptomyces lydicus TaxID=47763 RepID=UPI00331F88B4
MSSGCSTRSPRLGHAVRGLRTQRPHGRRRRHQSAGQSPARPDVRQRHHRQPRLRQHRPLPLPRPGRLRHPEVGRLELTYQSLDLPVPHRAVHDLTFYTAEPGSTSEDRLKLLTSLAAPQPRATEPTDQLR